MGLTVDHFDTHQNLHLWPVVRNAVFGLTYFGSAVLPFLAATTAAWAGRRRLAVGWLVVAVVYGAVAATLALIGKQKTREATPPAPEQAIESTKEDVQWAKSQLRSAKR